MTKVISFNKAVSRAAKAGAKRHVLLGNGFSIGAHEQFQYGTLYEQAKRESLPGHVIELFDRYGTTNFEQVLHQLDEGQWLAEHYRLAASDSDSERDMATDYESLKSALVDAIANTHPAMPSDIGEARLSSSTNFLKNFTNVFTTNYDLLLYWASLVQEPYRFKDGFGARTTPPVTTWSSFRRRCAMISSISSMVLST